MRHVDVVICWRTGAYDTQKSTDSISFPTYGGIDGYKIRPNDRHLGS